MTERRFQVTERDDENFVEHVVSAIAREQGGKGVSDEEWFTDPNGPHIGLPHPRFVLAGLAEVKRVTEKEVKFQVHSARALGMSWAEIGEQLGVTRQAAQQRYGPNAWKRSK